MCFDISLNDLKQLTQHRVTLLGNIPPRDVLASGTPEDVARATAELVGSLRERSRVIMSCGGGMPPGVSSANITSFLGAVRGNAGS
jgi:uroporphyrinogen decarboxylase